jgi:hypothetical protein
MPLGRELQPIRVLVQRSAMAHVPVGERRIVSYEGIPTPGILTAEAESTCESGPVGLALHHDTTASLARLQFLGCECLVRGSQCSSLATQMRI